MPDKLREFIYLDDVSVNSHLSSLGKAVPNEVVEQTQSEKETTGEGGIQVSDIGGKGRRVSTHADSTETTREVTAPYRFEDLRNTLVEEGIDIFDNPDVEAMARGDVVRIDGVFRPMSLYRFELAANAFLKLFDDETIESMDELNESQFGEDRDYSHMREGNTEKSDEEGDPEAAITFLQYFVQIAEKFTGDRIPLRIEADSNTVVTALNRDHLRLNHQESFVEERKYVLFGRVKEIIPNGDYWDPIEATNTIDKYIDGNDEPEGFRESLKEGADGMDISMSDEDLIAEGRTAVIHPIAVYW